MGITRFDEFSLIAYALREGLLGQQSRLPLFRINSVAVSSLCIYPVKTCLLWAKSKAIVVDGCDFALSPPLTPDRAGPPEF